MDYRFEISLPTSSDFRCEIAVGGEQTFQQFHDKIVETLNYDSSQMASFFTLDRMGNRVKEIALMDMAVDDEESENLVMDSTKISDIIKPGCLELEYVYDFFSNKYYKVEYAGEYIGDSADVLPLCVYCEGELPHQTEYDVNEDWAFDKDDDEYDDSFMEEFGGSGRRRRGGDDDDEDFRFGDEDDDYRDDSYGDDDGYDDRYESLDDYIDKL